jgi:DEAD/DEAH box helicase domain-containing protein
MIDPMGVFNRIRDFYISYLETAFAIRNEPISCERRQLLETFGTLCTEQIIEPIPRYRTADYKIETLVNDRTEDERVPGLDARDRESFVRLVLAGLFDADAGKLPARTVSKHRPYLHQVFIRSRCFAAEYCLAIHRS